MAEAPEMRASHLKSNLASLADLGATREQEIRGAVSDVVSAVDDASRVAWLPLVLDVRLTETVAQVCGHDAMKRWCSEAIVRSADGPLLRPIIVGLQAIGVTPHTALKRTPYAWGLIYRACGELRYERAGEREAVLVQEDAPSEMLESPLYLDGVAGSFDGAIAIGGGRGAGSSVEPDPTSRRVVYRCRWS